MRIQVYKCHFTGKIFEESDREKYIEHLKSLREQMRINREKDYSKKTWKDWLKAEKLKITRPEQIPEWFLKNQERIMEACNNIENTFYWSKDKFASGDKFEKLEFAGLRFSELVSNTHSCPEGGVQNFRCESDKPIGYIGWSGYLNGSLKRPKNCNDGYPYKAALNLIGIHTGSGGGANKDFGYDFKIFLDDWPGLKSAITRIKRLEAVAKILKERDEIVRRLKFRK